MLKGKHVGLRAIERDDLGALLAWRNRPDFRRFFRETRELGADQQSAWFEGTVLGDPKTRMFAITDLGDGRLLGACGLCFINWIDRNADLSIYIGDGHVYIDDVYAPDAAAALMRYGFDEMGLHRIWSEIYAIDTAKQALFADLGLTLDGRHRQTHWTQGQWTDSLFYGILASEFRAKNPG
jgi:hypothetical protein